MTINVGTASHLLSLINNPKFSKSASCLARIFDLLFNYRSYHKTNFTKDIKMDGSIDIIFEPVARNINFTFPNVSISLPFGSTSCVIAHTIPDHFQFLDAFDAISFISWEVYFIILIMTLSSCWILLSSRLNKLLDYGKTIWFVVQLLFNQNDDSQAKMKKYGSTILFVLIVTIGSIKIFFGVHFSAQLTVAKTYPTIDSLDQIINWNITKWPQVYTICPSLLAGSSAFYVYGSKKVWSGTTYNHMGQSEAGKVVSLLSTEEVSTLRNKLCAYYPDKRLHVSPAFGHTTVAFPLYSYLEPRKRKFLNNYLRTIMEMGLDKVMFACDTQRRPNAALIGDWNCANQKENIVQEAQSIPLEFYKRHFALTIICYFVISFYSLFEVILFRITRKPKSTNSVEMYNL